MILEPYAKLGKLRTMLLHAIKKVKENGQKVASYFRSGSHYHDYSILYEIYIDFGFYGLRFHHTILQNEHSIK